MVIDEDLKANHAYLMVPCVLVKFYLDLEGSKSDLELDYLGDN